MNELALFAGAGGGLLGSRLLGWRTACAVEINDYCRRVLLQRQRDGVLDRFPIWDDVRTFDGREWRGRVDVVTAGFPCQPFSVAGKQRGEADERNMWPETIRIIREIRPRYCLLENVPGLLCTSYWGTILGGLAESGLDVRWRVLSAAEAGAPHKRDRLWIMAYAKGNGLQGRAIPILQGQQKQTDADVVRSGVEPAQMADARHGRIPKRRRPGNTGEKLQESRRVCGNGSSSSTVKKKEGMAESANGGWWATEPDVGRVANGVAARVDRLKAIGNGQVPAVVRAAWLLLND